MVPVPIATWILVVVYFSPVVGLRLVQLLSRQWKPRAALGGTNRIKLEYKNGSLDNLLFGGNVQFVTTRFVLFVILLGAADTVH